MPATQVSMPWHGRVRHEPLPSLHVISCHVVPQIFIQGLPEGEGWPSQAELRALLTSRPGRPVTAQDIEGDVVTLLNTGVGTAQRPARSAGSPQDTYRACSLGLGLYRAWSSSATTKAYTTGHITQRPSASSPLCTISTIVCAFHMTSHTNRHRVAFI